MRTNISKFFLLTSLLLLMASCRPGSDDITSNTNYLTDASPQDAAVVDHAINRTLQFSGYDWKVRTTGNATGGPGGNYFSSWYTHAYVDEEGCLKLSCLYDSQLARWHCADVYLTQSLGYGTYSFHVRGDVNSLDPHGVIAGFTYEYAPQPDGSEDEWEIDMFEFAYWSDPAFPHPATQIVQPRTDDPNKNDPGYGHNYYSIPNECLGTSHRATWGSSSVEFGAVCGSVLDPEDPAYQPLAGWTYTGVSVPPSSGNERFHFNIWLSNNVSPDPNPAPLNGQSISVRYCDFAFSPPPAP